MAVDGKWDVTLNTPMGARPGNLELTSSGSALTGTFGGPEGSNEIQDGKVDGDDAEWAVNIQSPMGPMNLQFKGTVDGDKISGTVQLGSFGQATFEGARAS